MAVANRNIAGKSKKGLNRRKFLSALPIAGVSLSMPGMTEAGERETPVMTEFRKWRRCHDRATGNACRDMDDAEFTEIVTELRGIERRMIALPSTNPTDVLAKLVAFTMNGEDFADDDRNLGKRILSEAAATVEGALA